MIAALRPPVIDCVFDASAVLALLQDEPGAEKVAAALPGSAISSVNLAEVVSKLTDKHMPENVIRETLESLHLAVRPFDRQLAYGAGVLRSQTVSYGLSLGDRACLALAQHLAVPAFTADSVWQRLDIDGVCVELLR